ncbi:MAG: isoprenylcysteine carboxylmethyltransferase family protein [Defluviicoccus sp.]
MPPTLVLPPTFALIAGLTMAGLHRLVPLADIVGRPWHWVALAPVAAGLVLAIWAAAGFIRAGTPLEPYKDAAVLITAGPYRFSRNPIYLGMALLLAGFWLWLGSLSPGLVLPAFVIAIDRRFIQREEAHLEERFGARFRAYRASVRRWL